ncbi:MAG: hypothetical protein PHX24_12650, partial [Acidithiobacillus sp.]|nr:hypothetical protein [Acidithiobacillus sp.]
MSITLLRYIYRTLSYLGILHQIKKFFPYRVRKRNWSAGRMPSRTRTVAAAKNSAVWFSGQCSQKESNRMAANRPDKQRTIPTAKKKWA